MSRVHGFRANRQWISEGPQEGLALSSKATLLRDKKIWTGLSLETSPPNWPSLLIKNYVFPFYWSPATSTLRFQYFGFSGVLVDVRGLVKQNMATPNLTSKKNYLKLSYLFQTFYRIRKIYVYCLLKVLLSLNVWKFVCKFLKYQIFGGSGRARSIWRGHVLFHQPSVDRGI